MRSVLLHLLLVGISTNTNITYTSSNGRIAAFIGHRSNQQLRSTLVALTVVTDTLAAIIPKYLCDDFVIQSPDVAEEYRLEVYFGRCWDNAPETGSGTNRVRPNLGQKIVRERLRV
ncbi:hypothetical protein J6590_059006 [Homalodisca vitripennis]|nr:hypothetical protein J6590_059006 [Homalodisca vitripennis]